MRYATFPCISKAGKSVSGGVQNGWGVREETAYKYFISTSKVSGPPSELYILLSIGDISDCLIDCSVSTTVARCRSYLLISKSAPILNVLSDIPEYRFPSPTWLPQLAGRCSPSHVHLLRTAHSPKLPLTHPPSRPLLTVVLVDWKASALLNGRLREWRGGGRRCQSWLGIRGQGGRRLWCANSLSPLLAGSRGE